MIIILFGAPGAGKGTQSELLQQRLHLAHVASGDLLRENRSKGTTLGKLADTYLQRGELVPDDLVIEMITTRLQAPDTAHGAILDGFPRTVVQAEALDATLARHRERVDRVPYICVRPETLLDRMSGRWVCRHCQASYHEKFNPPRVRGVCDACAGPLFQRDDDRRDVAEHRLQVYFAQTVPVMDYYRRRGLLVEIAGEQEIEQVNADLMAAIVRRPDIVAPELEISSAA